MRRAEFIELAVIHLVATQYAGAPDEDHEIVNQNAWRMAGEMAVMGDQAGHEFDPERGARHRVASTLGR